MQHLLVVVLADRTISNFSSVVECYYRFLNKPNSASATRSTRLVLWSILKVLQTCVNTPLSQAQYTGTVDSLQRACRGHISLSRQKSQYLVAACACLGLYVPKEYLRYYISGNPKQCANLKNAPFLMKKITHLQIAQLRHCFLSARPELLPIQADCWITVLSEADPQKSLLWKYAKLTRNHVPYHARLGANGDITVLRSIRNNQATPARHESPPEVFEFQYTVNGNPYQPSWIE